MEIRLANEGDLPAIADIMAFEAEHSPSTFTIHPEPEATWRERFRKTSGMYPWLVAVENGVVLGFAKAGPHRDRDAYAYTVETSVFIHHEHRGRGAGKKLYDRLLALLHMQGYYTAVAVVTVPNPASEALHRRAGMSLAGTVARAGWKFERFHDTAFFVMQLQDDYQSPAAIHSVAAVTA